MVDYQELAKALYYKKFVDDDFTVSTSDVFGEEFRTHSQWLTFICHNFGASTSHIDGSIVKRNWFSPESFFQTMYVACWIYQPLEKGSYIIDFDQSQMAEIQKSYFSKLPTRKSSHLEGTNARSAGKGFDFLKGYEELLVQIPETSSNSLMFKAEGHAAASVAHLLGYVKKLKTGAGETANPNLNNLARYHQRFGIADRMAENYSKSYKQLLKFLGISKSRETVTVKDCMLTILNKKGIAIPNPNNPDIGHITTAFDKMLDGLASAAQKDQLDPYLKNAEQDLRKLSEALKKDDFKGKSPVPRYFNEVKGDTTALECALDVMRTALNSAK